MGEIATEAFVHPSRAHRWSFDKIAIFAWNEVQDSNNNSEHYMTILRLRELIEEMVLKVGALESWTRTAFKGREEIDPTR